MQTFTNNTIDTSNIPKFEAVIFSKLHPNYWKVMLLNLSLIILIAGIGLAFAIYNVEEIVDYQLIIVVTFLFLVVLIVVFSHIGFVKKGFAFREHDVLFKHGIIANNTTIIPYNRVQHVAIEEGLISRYFGLVTIEIFTAGGNSSDILIPGIEKEQAENIKQLLMGKIQKQL